MDSAIESRMLSRQYISDIRLKREEIPSFEQYPFSLPAVRHLDVLQLHPAVTFFVGENGSGKSTLLEAIILGHGDDWINERIHCGRRAPKCNPDGCRRWLPKG